MTHSLTIESDDGDVLALCDCGWGYIAPDADAARDAHDDHKEGAA